MKKYCDTCDIYYADENDPAYLHCIELKHEILDMPDKVIDKKEKKNKSKTTSKVKGFIGNVYVESVIVDAKPKFLAKQLNGNGEIVVKNNITADGETCVPLEANLYGYLPYRFSSSDVIDLTSSEISKEAILNEIKEQIDRFIVAKDLDKHLILGDILLTYCQEWISTIHFPFFVGETESGKSSVLHLGKFLNYRCLYGEDLPNADIYNFLGSDEEGCGTIAEDEAQEIAGYREKIRTYKNSYSKNSFKARMLMLQNKKQQLYYKTFCPKWFAGEKIPQDKGFLERLAIIYMIEGIPTSNIKRASEDEQKVLSQIRNKLLVWKLQNIGKEFLTIDSQLQGRDQELWEDFLSVVHGTKYFEKCQNVVKYYVNQRQEAIRNSLEAKLFNLLLEKLDKDFQLNFIDYWTFITQDNPQFDGSFKNNSQRTFYSDNHPEKITHHSLAKIIDYKFQGKKKQVKFRDDNYVQHQTTLYQFKKDVLQALVKKYGVGLKIDSPLYVGEQGEQGELPVNQDDQVDQVTESRTPSPIFEPER